MAERAGKAEFGRPGARMLAIFAPLLALCLSGCISVGAFAPPELERITVEKSPNWIEPNRVAIVDISGFISSEQGFWSMFGGTCVADVRQKLLMAAHDSHVRAVVLRINSPGGEAFASEMIYQEVLRFGEKTHKPVVAALMGTAASGGYFAALGADQIVASPVTITGSVGVIMDLVNIEGLYHKLGLKPVVIKSGEKKDIGSPMREMTAEERGLLQGLNQALFDEFLGAVKARRTKMTAENLAKVSDGRVVTGKEAKDLNLVDKVGNLRDAIDLARSLAGIDHSDVVLYRYALNYNTNIYSQANTGMLLGEAMNMLMMRSGPTFMYLWSPGL